MFLASWFRVPQFHRASVLNTADEWDRNRAGRRQPRRRPTHSRPFLEHLEERTLLNGASGVIGGGDNNLTVDGAAGSSGNVLPISTNGLVSDQAATSAFLAQDQPDSQLRLFGINSEGDDNRLVQRAATSILRDAFGFGSGSQPNAPWAPAAYNLGLANHQYGYPSQTDNGFFSTPPWYHQVAYVQPDAAPRQDAGSEAPFRQQSTQELQQTESRWLDEEAGEDTLDGKAPTKQGDDDSPVAPRERGDPAFEEALFSDLPYTLMVSNEANDFAAPWSSRGEDGRDSLLGTTDKGGAEENGIPSPLWLSAVAPAQMAALVVGLPGVEAPAEGGEVGSAVGAPE